MILKELRVMRGPNMWSAHHKVIAVKLDFNAYDDQKVQSIPLLITNLTKVDGMNKAKESTLLNAAELMGSLMVSLQPELPGHFSESLVKGSNSYYVVFSYELERVGIEAAYNACEIVEDLLDNKPVNLQEIKRGLKDLHRKLQMGPSTQAIVDAAVKRGISFKKIPGGLIMLGQGKYQKRIAASIIESTGNISVDIAGDKELTKQLLDRALIPIPRGYSITREESLKEISEDLGYPLVTKPLNGHQGKGITSDITKFETLVAGFKDAQKHSRTVIVEKHIKGDDYRFLVIGYKLVAVAKRTPAAVTGDGRSTIEELVNIVNSDPKRGDGHGSVLTKIIVDDSVHSLLHSKQLNLYSIPKEGETVYLKDTANLSTGGTAIDVTDEVHPENILLAERAARIIGLDICGIDIMAPDVSTSLMQNGGAVLEVNAAPGLRMHIAPSYGTPRNVGEPIIDLLFPKDTPSKIPIVAVTGTNGKTTTSRLMAFIAGREGYNVGFTSTDGVYLNNTCIFKGDCSGPKSTEVILDEPGVDFAVLECARGGIIRSGLAFKECDIAIVTNVAADHLGQKDIFTIEDLAGVKSVVPQAVSKNGYSILNACDDLVYKMKDRVTSKVALFSIDPKRSNFTSHCEKGGTGITLNDDKNIIIYHNNKTVQVENVLNIPLTMKGKASFMIENVLSTVLASYLLGFSMENIQKAIRTFKPSAEHTPGRLNLFDINGINVIVDYAHNPHGLKALSDLLKQIEEKKTGIITGVGDRREEDIKEVGRVAASMYDEVIIRLDKDTRGRSENEIVSLITSGLEEVNTKIKHQVIPDSKAALKFAIEKAKRGDYVVISADDAMQTIEIVKELEKELTV
ncbi:MAG: hypothetical protein JWO32_2356 [Bacteroidetes bacterium]|nr:hypothetical protein [Bacteroidota bacterium]